MEKKISTYKKKIVKELAKRISKSKNIFVTNYGGLKNKELEQLRSALKDVSSDYMVVKNSLTKQALKECKVKDLEPLMEGAVGITFGESDYVAESKALVGFAKDHEALKIVGAFADGKMYTSDEIKRLAMLPTREVLLAQTVTAMKSPINSMVYVLKENLRKLASALNEISKKKTQ